MPPKKVAVLSDKSASVLGSIAPGTKLGVLTIGPLLGRGEFGFVYEAKKDKDPETYAVKICDCAPTTASKSKIKLSQEALTVFREYTIYTSTLQHPGNAHIVKLPSGATSTVVAYGTELRYLLMPKLGDSLLKRVRAAGDRIPWKTAAAMGIQIIEALRYLHGKNLVYIDISAGNVVFGLPEKGEADFAYLMDFGLAENYRSITGEEAKAKGDGTPLYSSVSASIDRCTYLVITAYRCAFAACFFVAFPC